MANLTESSLWEPGIYQWENTDPIEGGPNGIDNVPTRQLANRTRWLRDRAVLDNEAKTITSLHTFAGGLATGLIHRGTADGADNGALSISGGGAAEGGRGGHLTLYGNEHATEAGNLLYTTGAGGRHRFYAYDGSTFREAAQITSTGVLLMGGATRNSAATGEVELANGKAIWGNIASGAGSLPLIRARPDSTYNVIEIGHQNTASVAIGSVATLRGATGGDVVMGYGKAVRGNNAGGDGSWSMIRTAADTSTQKVDVGDPNCAVSIAGATVIGANYGDLVLGNQKNLRGANAAGTATLPLIQMDSANDMKLGWSPSYGAFMNTFHNVVNIGQTPWTAFLNWSTGAGFRRVQCSASPPAGSVYLYITP